MLPDTLYKILPYLSLAAGVFCGVVVEPDSIAIITSSLFLSAGLLVLWKRHYWLVLRTKYKAKVKEPVKRSWDVISQTRHERRFALARAFPLTDDRGNVIAFDRRVGHQSISGFA